MDTIAEAAYEMVTLFEPGQNQSQVKRHLNLSRYAAWRVYQLYQETGGYTRRQGIGRKRVAAQRELSQHHFETAGWIQSNSGSSCRKLEEWKSVDGRLEENYPKEAWQCTDQQLAHNSTHPIYKHAFNSLDNKWIGLGINGR